jgi:hypothetical protein
LHIQVIESLTASPIPPKSNILVEFDADSQWYNMSFALASDWIRQGGIVSYNLLMRSPEKLRSMLRRHGLDAAELEHGDKLRIQDYYTATLGKASAELHGWDSLKVQDLSVQFAKFAFDSEAESGLLRIWDNLSVLGRFNDDKVWVEFMLSRGLPIGIGLGATTLHGIVNGVHESWVYRRLEDVHDGIVDVRVGDDGKELVRIRNMREVGFDRKWRELTIGPNFEVSLRG